LWLPLGCILSLFILFYCFLQSIIKTNEKLLERGQKMIEKHLFESAGNAETLLAEGLFPAGH